MEKLIIVCDDKYRNYGDFLAQLISLKDDKGENIIGTRDGSVVAQVWLEKEYKDNSAKISSNQHIVFIGGEKLAKEKSTHMLLKYNEYGMKYGWLGKQAALYVDEIVDIEDYDTFYSYAAGKQENVVRLIESKEKQDKKDEDDGKKKHGIPSVIKKVPSMGLIAIKQLSANRKIEEQQYSCLTYVFYLNGLREFLDQ